MLSHLNAQNRHDFVLLFDVSYGNPEGDPDAGGLPRVDCETGHGLVTDTALKHMIRNYIKILKNDEARYKIYFQDETENKDFHPGFLEIQSTHMVSRKSQEIKQICRNYYDIRTFGAELSEDSQVVQIHGPVQLTMATSIDPVTPLEIALNSSATHRKNYIPYGLYKVYGYYTPYYADKTGFDNEDLALLWQSLLHMWDFNHNSTRGALACRSLYIYSHNSALGNASAQQFFDFLNIKKREEIGIARNFFDYTIWSDDGISSPGVTSTLLV